MGEGGWEGGGTQVSNEYPLPNCGMPSKVVKQGLSAPFQTEKGGSQLTKEIISCCMFVFTIFCKIHDNPNEGKA